MDFPVEFRKLEIQQEFLRRFLSCQASDTKTMFSLFYVKITFNFKTGFYFGKRNIKLLKHRNYNK